MGCIVYTCIGWVMCSQGRTHEGDQAWCWGYQTRQDVQSQRDGITTTTRISDRITESRQRSSTYTRRRLIISTHITSTHIRDINAIHLDSKRTVDASEIWRSLYVSSWFKYQWSIHHSSHSRISNECITVLDRYSRWFLCMGMLIFHWQCCCCLHPSLASTAITVTIRDIYGLVQASYGIRQGYGCKTIRCHVSTTYSSC